MNNILQYNGYYAAIEFNATDEVFHGKLLGINDLVSFEGTSVRELKKAFKEAVDDYLETCKSLGKEPERFCKGSFNVRISSELHRKAALVSAARNMSLNDFIRYAIDFALSKSAESKMTSLNIR